jgi:hypothetical protein
MGQTHTTRNDWRFNELNIVVPDDLEAVAQGSRKSFYGGFAGRPPRQSGILAPCSTVPVGAPGVLVCSSAGVLCASTVGPGAGETLLGSTAEAAGGVSCSSAGALSGSTVAAGAGDILFGSTAAGAGDILFGSTAAGAGDILFGSTAAGAGCVSFGSTAAVGSSGAFVSCAGRGRGSGGDDTIRRR